MRRMLALVLTLVLLLAACARTEQAGPAPEKPAATPAETAAGDTGAAELARAVADSQPDLAGLSPFTGDELIDYLSAVCGVERAWWTEGAVYTASGVNAREIIVLRLSRAEDAEYVTAALEEHRQARLGDFWGYAPEQAALLEDGVVAILGEYAALLVCDDPDGAAEVLETRLDSQAGRAPVPEKETFAPFDPPNEHDMTLYDTSAILAAWESGEEDGLSEKDAAILARCRALFAEHLTEGMTDFEKELALHDALVRLGDYDETVYEDGVGRPDNTNPYGLLVGGYGICMAYAVSFQLLMDLAGVECITVVGTSSFSTSDHAWNMVRLEGEWYCVDCTWDDPIGGENVSPGLWNEIHHEYFNVTSEDMRESDHQWDYANVPEADAVRFRWNGTGRLPR